jgi:DNA-binding MarR family transcriptional regulator
MHRAIWAVKRAHWWTWMKARKLLRQSARRPTLTPARFDVLFVLSERGRMMQRSLRRVLGVMGSTMSEMLGDLEKRGFVARGKRSRAGRSVELTKAGDDALSNAFYAYMELDDAIGSAFGGAWFGDSCARLLIWERVCRRVRHACGDTQFKRAFGWIQEPDD